MRESIPRPIDGYREIKPSELEEREVTTEERKLIKQFRKKYNSSKNLLTVFFFAWSSLFTYLAWFNSDLDTLILAFCFYFAIALAFKGRIPSRVPSKIQIGHINGKWSMCKGNNSTHRNTYFNVIFPENSTQLRKIICSKNDFEIAEKSEQVLVFTYNGKVAYGCLLK